MWWLGVVAVAQFDPVAAKLAHERSNKVLCASVTSTTVI
jgi:hypothetical protein